jgi:2-oxo-hept-3-ene-1,7-dioate hydratase/2-keto-4-pentenoate hydratase
MVGVQFPRCIPTRRELTVLSAEERKNFAGQLYSAIRSRQYIRPLTETFPDCDVESAYAIARLVNEAKVADGLTVKGHKIGLTSKVLRERSGSTEPDFGTIFSDMFIDECSSVSRSNFNRGVGVEIEIAFILSRNLHGPHATIVDVIRATEVVVPAIEIVDSRYARPGPGPVIVDSVADGAWCGGVVLGGNPRRLDQIDVRGINGSISINGQTVASGVSAAAMGNPLIAVAWLANKLSEFGIELQAGQVVMSGSFTDIVRLRTAGPVVATFDHFGDVGFLVED